MRTITRHELRRRLEGDEGLVIVEVLGPDEFSDYHLPTAVNIPFGVDFEASLQRRIPERSTEIVVYCRDADCDTAPRAVARMAQLGYGRVYDYVEGKRAWRRAGLPVERCVAPA